MYYQVPRNEDMDRRMRLLKVEKTMWTVLGILEFLLGLRLFFNLIAASLISGFSGFIQSVTGIIIAPFGALLGMPVFAGSVFEMTTLAAMAAYALIFWIIISMNGSLIARTTKISQETDDRVTEPPSSYAQETVLQNEERED